ncbi:hypothetical protein C0J52_08465 [Blattella germanica]|nr:hypothetical protein C0J52_08465 [Blattella germanica]
MCQGRRLLIQAESELAARQISKVYLLVGFIMTSRSVLGRPRRTKVYDCNFSAGERYYRPVVDSLDRKTTGSSATPERTIRSNLLADSEPEPVTVRRRTPRVDDDIDYEDTPRRKVNSALMDEYDSIFENRNRAIRGEKTKTTSSTLRSLEDEADREITSYLKRIQDNRPAKPSFEDEFESAVTPRNSKRRQLVDFQEKLLDTVGIQKSSQALEEDSFFKKRTFKITSEDDEEAPSLTKWTAIKARNGVDAESDDYGAAAARARKTRNRLQDLDNEIEELSNRSAAREKRVAQLRAFVKENEANAASESSVSTRVVQKASVRSEKKTVTF